MVCLHCPTPIPKPISMEMDPMIMCRTVSTEPTQIPILIPVLIPMATVPNLVLISVPIWWNLLIFIVTLHQYHHWVGISGPLSFLVVGYLWYSVPSRGGGEYVQRGVLTPAGHRTLPTSPRTWHTVSKHPTGMLSCSRCYRDVQLKHVGPNVVLNCKFHHCWLWCIFRNTRRPWGRNGAAWQRKIKR